MENLTVLKPWGREEWLVSNDKYALKRLYIDGDKRLSLQYHERKKETMILESGVCDLTKDDKLIIMKSGKAYTINPKEIHRLTAHTDVVILEVSTPDLDDVVRCHDDYGRVVTEQKDL